jgi:mannose-6-phosphate isomerase
MLGETHYQKYGTDTAFLIKFLDSAVRLHFQCHPTITFAQKYLNSNHGKTEGYYILETRPEVKEPYIYMGFQHPPSKEKLKTAIEHQDIPFLESCFEKIPVKKGDVFYVPGGLPHAIGEGVFMIEIMEPTDFVARIEFEKAGYTLPEKARFMDRGIDFALSMFDLTPLPVATIRKNYFIKPRLSFENGEIREWVLFDTSVTTCFRLNKLEIKNAFSLKKDGFYIAVIIKGSGELLSGDEKYNAGQGDKFFIPAATGDVLYHTTSGMEVIIAMPPL